MFMLRNPPTLDTTGSAAGMEARSDSAEVEAPPPDAEPTAALSGTPVTVSRGFVAWMIRHRVALVCSSARGGDLFFIGSAPNGSPVFSRARFSRTMGLAGFSQRLFLADCTQIWRLENALAPGKIANERFDRVYAPRSSAVTGDVDTH